VLFGEHEPMSRRMAPRPEKMQTTSLLQRISRLSRSCGLLDQNLAPVSCRERGEGRDVCGSFLEHDRDIRAFAMHVGTAPLPVSSGQSRRYRLHRTGNRSLNSAIHMIAVTQMRMHPPAIAFMERKRAEGMSTQEALRCLKRHLSRVIFKTMLRGEQARLGKVIEADFASEIVAAAA
jgi:hypothetical protein